MGICSQPQRKCLRRNLHRNVRITFRSMTYCVVWCSVRARAVTESIIAWSTAPPNRSAVTRSPNPSRRSRAGTRCRAADAGLPGRGDRYDRPPTMFSVVLGLPYRRADYFRVSVLFRMCAVYKSQCTPVAKSPREFNLVYLAK